MKVLLAGSTTILIIVTATAMSAAEERRPPNRDQLICKSEPKTGSRFGRRTCTTKSERERLVADQQRKAGEIVDRPMICVGKEGC